MKKWIALLLALVMCMSLCACGGKSDASNGSSADKTEGNTADTVTETVWVAQQSTDEFGDVTEDSETIITAPIEGDFSNTATASSDLGGSVTIFRYRNQFIPYFLLAEYNDHIATYTSSDLNEGIILKTKVNDSVQEYTLTGSAPNGALVLNDPSKAFTFYYELRKNQADMKCIIEIGSSKYNFTIKYGNLAQISEEVFGIPTDTFDSSSGEMSLAEAFFVLLTDDGIHSQEAGEVLKNNLERFKPMTDDEIMSEINGQFLKIDAETFTPYRDMFYAWWSIWDISSEESCRIMEMNFAEGRGFRPFPLEVRKEIVCEQSASDGQMILHRVDTDIEYTEQCYKVTDNLYVMMGVNSVGSMFVRLYVRLPYEIQSGDDAENFYDSIASVMSSDLKLIPN